MKYRVVFLSLIAFFTLQSAYAFDVEKPYAKGLVVKLSDKSPLTVDLARKKGNEWLGYHDYVIIRVPKETGTLVSAQVTREGLGHCLILANVQGENTIWSDVVVSFEAEGDDGFNSCDVTLKNKNRTRLVELGVGFDD